MSTEELIQSNAYTSVDRLAGGYFPGLPY